MTNELQVFRMVKLYGRDHIGLSVYYGADSVSFCCASAHSSIGLSRKCHPSYTRYEDAILMVVRNPTIKLWRELARITWFSSQRRLGAELKVEVGTSMGHFQYISFGPGTSRNQVIMQILLLSHSWRLQSFSVLLCSFCLEVNRSACFDESFSWSNADWSCSTLDVVVADFFGLQQYRRKQQCHGVFAWLVQATRCVLSFRIFAKCFIRAGALGFLPTSAA
ncbi:hypothetical protein Patl1_12846 [Pistacia atlantica]|uniref:Uncharacterized protein n=1 Tax=Pistacia atlantica TaxID=434234 RepID=A0ACC1AU23_9ROSI|nr:hypothetical protein Patl1_12846 [Pistacia atlantica]